jgi:uncharacterized surface protein with fasciclin (FAS1) repeats
MRQICVISALLFLATGFQSCKHQVIEAGFEDQEKMTIYDYMVENEDKYSSFLRILEVAGIDKTLSAYNPYATGYTLFLPGNDAIDKFIAESGIFSSLDELLQDKEYSSDLGRYHTVLLGINSNDFPFGALPGYTMSGDLLTVNFVIEEDTSYYKINNQAPVIQPNIELSNGYVHVIGSTLHPVNFNTYEWLQQHSGYSIFKSAVDATGLQEVIEINLKDENATGSAITLLVEPDTVFNKRDIYTLEDLAASVSPDRSDYTNPSNPLHTFTAYHMITDNEFLGDFEEKSTNYSTYSEIPLNINGMGLDIIINKGKQIFDTIINTPDTVIIDYIGFDYDASNVISQSGAIHIIDQIMRPQQPSRAIQTYEFYEEPLLNTYRLEPGTYLIDDTTALYHIRWTGADLFFTEEASPQESSAWGADYLYISGDFSISYTVPKIVGGRYRVLLRFEGLNRGNAVVEVFIDGKNMGGLVNLASGGSTTSPFTTRTLGTIDFLKYEQHTVTIRTLIPGSFYWDFVRFEPN